MSLVESSVRHLTNKEGSKIWNSLKRFVELAFGMTVAMLGFGLVICIGLLPQFGLVWFVEYGGGPMLLPLFALAILGRLFRKSSEFRFSIIVCCLCILVMANMRGFYWHPFPSDEGFFTLNRASAHGLFLVSFVLTGVYDKLAGRFGWGLF
jgi:hypothetical protein